MLPIPDVKIPSVLSTVNRPSPSVIPALILLWWKKRKPRKNRKYLSVREAFITINNSLDTDSLYWMMNVLSNHHPEKKNKHHNEAILKSSLLFWDRGSAHLKASIWISKLLSNTHLLNLNSNVTNNSCAAGYEAMFKDKGYLKGIVGKITFYLMVLVSHKQSLNQAELISCLHASFSCPLLSIFFSCCVCH